MVALAAAGHRGEWKIRKSSGRAEKCSRPNEHNALKTESLQNCERTDFDPLKVER